MNDQVIANQQPAKKLKLPIGAICLGAYIVLSLVLNRPVIPNFFTLPFYIASVALVVVLFLPKCGVATVVASAAFAVLHALTLIQSIVAYHSISFSSLVGQLTVLIPSLCLIPLAVFHVTPRISKNARLAVLAILLGVSGLRFFAIFFTSLNYVRFERSFSYIFSYFSLNLIFAAAIALIGWWLYDPYAKSAALQRPAYAAPAQPQRPTYTGAYAPQQTAYTAPAQPQQPTYTGAYAPQQTAYTPPMQPQRPVYPTYAAPAQPVYAQPYAPQQPSAKQSDEIERLKEYKALLDQGILTQEEFDQKKKELLGL